jgi:hypothetical protein
MRDVDGPRIVTEIYKQLFGGGLDFVNPDDVPYALDDAIRKLREEGVHPIRWAPYIHIGL